MRKLGLSIGSLLVTVLMALTASLAFAADTASDKEFCWRDSHTRGVGTVPEACSAGRDRIGLLCYSKCGPNSKRFGFDCHSVCPSGMRDDGLFCRAAEYGRGAGYPWKFGDGLNDKGMYKRCQAAQGNGNCEKNGAIVYPKCKPGYHNVGCCICRPNTPDCGALGLGGRLDLSCAKKISIGDPVTGVCNANQDKDAGLCYSKCKPGYNGVGPVCWGVAPKGWVECGMGSAKDSKTCGMIVFGQVASVGNLALTVASLGTSTAATGAAGTAADAGKLAQLKQQLATLKALYEKAKPALDAIKTAKKTAGVIVAEVDLADDKIVTAEDIARVAAQIAAIADPTGVADTVAAYTYPKCSKYFGDQYMTGGAAPATPATPATPTTTPATPAGPAAGGKLGWAAGPAVPANAVIGGQESGRTLPVCRTSHNGGVHPGKVVAGNCNIGWGGKEIVQRTFEVLTNNGATLAWVAGPGVPANAVIGGQETGRSLPVCRGSHNGGMHPGKVVAGNCNIGWGGNEIVLRSFEVLTQK